MTSKLREAEVRGGLAVGAGSRTQLCWMAESGKRTTLEGKKRAERAGGRGSSSTTWPRISTATTTATASTVATDAAQKKKLRSLRGARVALSVSMRALIL